MLVLSKRGQISIEYLIVIGFVVFIILSILGVSIYYYSGIRDSIKLNQVTNFASKVISSAEVVFFAGEPSKTTITVHLPEGVQDVRIIDDNGQTLIVFDVSTDSGLTVVAFPSDVPIDTSSDISNTQGVKRLEIVALADRVAITEI